MITFIVPGHKARTVTCDGCGKKVSETDAYGGGWKHKGTKRESGLPIGGMDYCPPCQKKRFSHGR